MFNNEDRKPAVWKEQEHFAVSEKGIIKPAGPGYSGRLSFLNLETAQHILSNLDSFRLIVEESRKATASKEMTRDLNRMRVTFIKQGLTPDQAEQAVQAILENTRKLKQQPA